MKFRIVSVMLLLAVAATSGGCNSEQDSQSPDATERAHKPAMTAGNKLFINNCAQCHALDKHKIGPKLESAVWAKWDNDTTRLYSFIRNSQAAVKSGDPRAVEVYDEWNHVMMTPMPHLSDADINQIMEYIVTGSGS